MKNSIFCVASILFFSSTVLCQSIFKILEGETFVVEKKNAKMLVDKWIMEDNSQILISDDLDGWEINANEASFGNNCRIVGIGKNGTNGKSSSVHGTASGECKDGGWGGNGNNGAKGSSGKMIKIVMGLLNVNDLYIDVSGGDGGIGGNGAKAEKEVEQVVAEVAVVKKEVMAVQVALLVVVEMVER